MSILVDIEKRLGDFHLKVAFEAGNETLSLLGASGSGKSVTLQCIAGILTPDRGHIELDGVTLFDEKRRIDLPPQQRRVGLLFQNYALFPHMTLRQNLRAGCRKDRSKAEREAAVSRWMEVFGLTPLADRYPAQLSGGEQQRTALARILLSEPKGLLLDEPFSALDAHLRFRLEREMTDVLRSFGKTVLLVSHDRDEIFRMSDKIAVMHRGHIEVQGSREEVFRAPRTRQAAILTGCKNVAACRALDDTTLQVPEWGMRLQVPRHETPPDHVGIRMHDICPGGGENQLVCQVVSELENPFSYVVLLRPADAPEATPIGWEVDKDTWRALRSEQVLVHIPVNAILLCSASDTSPQERDRL